MEQYLRNIQKALDFIEANINRKIFVPEVAAAAGYSSYHFQRLFRGVVGEPIREYIRKRKLTNAAQQLSSSKTRILDLALDAGFESQEAFTRAFQKQFKSTPGEFRKTPSQPYFQGRKQINEGMLAQLVSKYLIEHETVTWNDRYFIGIGGAFGENVFAPVAELWESFSQRTHEISQVVSRETFGICTAVDQAFSPNADTLLCYLASLEVDGPKVEIPPGMHLRKLPGATYAKFSHVGPLEQFETTLDYIWGSFLPKAEYQRLDAPDLEVYHAGFNPHANEVRIDVYIPLQS